MPLTLRILHFMIILNTLSIRYFVRIQLSLIRNNFAIQNIRQMTSVDQISEPTTDPHENESDNPRSVKFLQSQVNGSESNVLNQTDNQESNENNQTTEEQNDQNNDTQNSNEPKSPNENNQPNATEEEENENNHPNSNEEENESSHTNANEEEDNENHNVQPPQKDEISDPNPQENQATQSQINNPQNTNDGELSSQQDAKSIQEEDQIEFIEESNGPDPNDLDYWTKEALSLHSLDGCNPRLLNKVCNQILEERDHLVEMGLYDDSVKANEALSIAQEYKDSVYKRIVQKKKQEDLADRLEDAKKYLANLQEMVKRQEPNMISAFEEEMAHLVQRQNDELEQLTETWESEKKKRLYNRSSAGLRNLRTQSILLLNSHRFDEMQQVQKKADELRLRESYNNQRQLETDFQEKLTKTLDRHEIERNNLRIAQNVQRDKYEAAKKHDFNIAQMRIQKLEHELFESSDVEKVWVHYVHGEMRGPPGPKPTARSGRKNCLQTIKVADFNTLNLPPLLDDPKWRMSMPRNQKQKEEKAHELISLARTGGTASSRVAETMHGGAKTLSPRSPRKMGLRTRYPRSSPKK